jgi:hypothetical protein
MNLNKNEFNTKLSKHELILERYKTLLLKDEKDERENKVKNIEIYDRNNKVNNMSETENKLKIEELLANKLMKRAYLQNENNQLNNPKDKIELIKAKYSNGSNNIQINEKSLVPSSSSLPMSMSLKNNMTSKFNDILSLKNENIEIDLIKSKYTMKNNINNTLSNITSKYNTNIPTDNPLLEEKLNKYKLNKSFDTQSQPSIEINQRSHSFDNKLKTSTESLLNDKIDEPIHSEEKEIENKETLLLNRLSDVEKRINLLGENKELKTNSLIIFSDNKKNNKAIKYEDRKIINIEIKQNIKKSIDNSHKINSVNDILNNFIAEVTGSLFNNNKVEENINENNTKIINPIEIDNPHIPIPNKINKTKIFKSNIRKGPTKNLKSFDEFLLEERK